MWYDLGANLVFSSGWGCIDFHHEEEAFHDATLRDPSPWRTLADPSIS